MALRIPALSCAALLAAASAFAQPAMDPNRVVVKVNNEPIVLSQYFSRMQVMPDVGRLVGDKFAPGYPGLLTLQQLINERLMVQLAREQGVMPSDAEIDAEVARRKTEEAFVYELFKRLQLTEDEFRWDTTVNLAQYRLITKGVNVVDMEVEARYKTDLAARYTLPKRYTLRVISVEKKEDQAKVDAALAAGRPWGDVAKEFGRDSTSLNEGRFAVMTEEQLNTAPIGPEIKKLQKDGKTPWVSAANNTSFFKFWLENVQEKEIVPLDDPLKKAIRRELLIERGQARNNLPRMMDEMRKKARFEFSGGPFDEQLRNLFQPGSGS